MKTTAMLSLAVAAFLLVGTPETYAGGVTMPGTRYCGPGNKGGAPTNALDSACKAHDDAYKSKRDYLPVVQSERSRQADRTIAQDARKVANDPNASRLTRVEARVVAKFFETKTKVDNAGRKAIQALKPAKPMDNYQYPYQKRGTMTDFRPDKR